MSRKYLVSQKTCTGFGEVGMETSFWLGLEALHQLTTNGAYTRMRAEVRNDDGAWYSAEYDHFSVGNETAEYRLTVSGYCGDAGDHLWSSYRKTFSTYDQGTQSYLAGDMEGGWWYSGYDFACLNGEYEIFTPYGEATGFYWNSSFQAPPPETSSLVGVTPGRLRMSRIMIARP